jgi:sulfur carrier protein ThiS adenylyltransferase
MATFPKIAERLSQKCVGIAGLGGLGSNCAAALVRTGVGKLVVADFDVVSESNLNRQFYFADQMGMKKVEALYDNLMRIRPYVALSIHPMQVTPENIGLLFADCDVVVEALDSAQEKAWFIFEMTKQLPHIPLVAASGMAGWGALERIEVLHQGNLTVCGDGITEVSEEMPPLAPRVGVVACMQADVVVELLMKNYH